MNECVQASGVDTTPNIATSEPRAIRNPIITPGDQERWPLLEMSSQLCGIPLTEGDRDAIIEMDDILNTLGDEAAGLAAIQIGYPKRIFLLRNGSDNDNNVYINPSVLAISKEMKLDGEGCLSLPGMGGFFKRPKKVTLQYFDLDGKQQTETFSGFWARAVMHEMDHLDGRLITRHMEEKLSKEPRKTSFGMKITPTKIKQIQDRRDKKKRARKARRHLKSIGR